MEQQHTERLTVVLPAHVAEWLRSRAVIEDRSVSSMVRCLLSAALSPGQEAARS